MFFILTASRTTIWAHICKMWWITTNKTSSASYRFTGGWYKSCSCSSSTWSTPTTSTAATTPAGIRCWDTRSSTLNIPSSDIVEVILPSASQATRCVSTNQFLDERFQQKQNCFSHIYVIALLGNASIEVTCWWTLKIQFAVTLE